MQYASNYNEKKIRIALCANEIAPLPTTSSDLQVHSANGKPF